MNPIVKALTDLYFLPELHAVGGCVRDYLLGRSISDVDLATSAVPEKVISLCEEHSLRVIPTGIDHGTVTVVVTDGTHYEVTTFRKDVSTDGRRAVVAWADSIEDDLARRDFTINAIAVRLSKHGDLEYVDPYGAMDDLAAKVIRCMGDADKRFREDYLRVIRACRFAARFHMRVSVPTYLAMRRAAPHVLENVSVERVTQEFEKAFQDTHPDVGSPPRVWGQH